MLLELLDTLIAFLMIVALLSVLVMALSQATQSVLRLRGRNLQRGLETLSRQAMVTTQEPGKEKPVGLLVVHGIGAQKRGATLSHVVEGLRIAYPDARIEQDGDFATMTVRRRQIRLYEVFWADVLSGEAIAGSFSLNQLHRLVWFPCLNRWHIDDHKTNYPWWRVYGWTLILLPVSMMVTAVYWSVVTVCVLFGFAGRVRSRALAVFGEQRSSSSGVGPAPTLIKASRAKVDDWLADRIGDLFNYLDAFVGAQAHVPGAHEEIYRIFRKTLKRASAECSELQILAHSMGTLVTHHALSNFREQTEEFLAAKAEGDVTQRPPLTKLYTIGNPLGKILFFWPKAINCSSGWKDIKWHNFRNPEDLISGYSGYRTLGDPKNWTVKGAGGLLRAHRGYRTHPTFLNTFGPGLTKLPTALRRGVASRSLRFVLDLVESIVVYAAFVILALGGIKLFHYFGRVAELFPGVSDAPLSALSGLAFEEQFLALFPHLLGTAFVAVAILAPPFLAWRSSRQHHQEFWRKDRAPVDRDGQPSGDQAPAVP